MTDTATTPPRPRLAAPASAVAATTGAAFDEAIALTRRPKPPHIRRAMAEVIPTAKAQRREPPQVVRALLAEEAAGRDAAFPLITRRRPAGARPARDSSVRGVLRRTGPRQCLLTG
ncbi:hypothetical protein ACWGAN_15325 [Streptomyces sp. NPDC054945]